MDGVIILTTEQAYTLFEAILLAIGVCGMFVFGSTAFVMLDESLPISCVLAALSTICLIFSIQIPKSETRYKVMIEDNVSWNELSEHYNIIKTDGKIITLVEKEQDNETD